MSFSVRYLPAILIAILTVATSLFAQSTTKQTPKVPRGSLSGRVTIKDKGAPGVAIGLRKGDPGPMVEPYQRAVTDQDGVYRFNNLAAGNYTVTASAPAYVVTNIQDARLKTVLVGEDENVEDINFSLVRGGVITGRVTDADGRAVIDQQVQIFPVELFQQQGRGGRPIYPTGTGQTDDRGIYRVFGLIAGRYKVGVGRNDDARSIASNQVRNTSYRQVFHPDVIDQAKATVIEVSEGSETANVDITLGRAIQTFIASGVAIDKEKGLPVPNLRFGVQRLVGQRMESVGSAAITNSRGELVLEGLIPGKYMVFMYPNQSIDLRSEMATFEIVDHDIDNLTVKLVKGASASGVLVLENYDKAVFEKLLQLQLRGYSTVPSMGSAVGSALTQIGADGSFLLTNLAAGHLNLLLAAPPNPFPPKGFTIMRIERDGVLAPRGVDLKEGEQVTGLRVTIAYGSATIRGVVSVQNGPAPPGTRFFVRLTKPGETTSFFRPPIVDERGHFLVEGVPAGTYELIALLAGAPPRQTKQSITVVDGATLDVTMTIDLNAPLTKP